MTAQRFMNRKRLLDAVRGLYKPSAASAAASTDSLPHHHPRPLRCFRLESKHVHEMFSASTPDKFHSMLCQKILNAKHRVYLASLYVGPAACPKAALKEKELLHAIQEAANNPHVSVKLLLDKNRALRPVPVSGKDGPAATTSSAEAVYQALQPHPNNNNNNNNNNTQNDPSDLSSDVRTSAQNKNQLFLFSVLPLSLQYFLPNPYNEVMGVFHIKVYIIDDSIILSGANLSEEYFVDRHDRYLQISQGGGGLVDCYVDLIHALCDHSEVYSPTKNDATAKLMKSSNATTTTRTPTTRSELLESLTKVLTVEDGELESVQEVSEGNEEKTVAYVVPTFQAPASFFSDSKKQTPTFLFDTQVTNRLLQTALEEDPSSIVRLSSAYLNPTNSFLRVLSGFGHIEFLTAGRISHGFAPKKKAGNKGKDWIPTVFDTVSRDACEHLDAAKLWHYSRSGWTFHSKGLWLEEESSSQDDATSSECSLAAAICGSGNYGARSETLDMESNCVFVLPVGSELEAPLQQEWRDMMEYTQLPPPILTQPTTAPTADTTKEDEHVTTAPLSWPLQVCLPIIRKFL